MFFGTYDAALDAKNRVAFPARLRDAIPDAERRSVVLARHPDRILVLYTASEWARIMRDLDERSRLGPNAEQREFERVLFGRAMAVDVDGVGRILLPEPLRTWAGIRKNVVFVGARNRIELWNEERFAAEEQKRDQIFLKLGNDLLR